MRFGVSATLNASDRDLLRRANWRLLITALRWSMVNGLVAGLLKTALIVTVLGENSVILWFASLVVVTLVRAYSLRSYARAAVLGRRPRRARAGILGGLAAAGLLWGGSALVFMPTNDPTAQALFCFFAAGMTAGASATMNSIMIGFLLFSGPYLALLITGLAMAGTTVSLMMAVTVLAYALGMLSITHNSNQHNSQTLRLWLVNRRLTRELLRSRNNEQTAHDQALELLKAKEKAEAAAEAKTRFLATVSHELRTPLTPVIGFSEIIANEVYGSVGDPRYREYARHVCDSGEKLMELIDDILTITKFEYGERPLDRQPVRLEPFCKELVQLFAAGDGAEPGRVKCDIRPADAVLCADPRLLRQCLLNLVGNALKFSASGTPVFLESRLMANGDLRIRVRDEGIGIPESQLAAVTEPFVQASNNTEAPTKGIGIGLSVVKTITDLHNWRLNIASEQGVGTTIDIIVPQPVGAHGEPQTDRAPAIEASRS
jgi:signal transduction histidine kinase